MSTTSRVFLGGLFTILGYFVAFWWGKPMVDEARASTKWPTVLGKVVVSRITEDHTERSRTYSADVHYTFRVESKEHRGSTIWFGQGGSSNRDQAQDAVNQFPVGREVQVYYNPTDPEQNVLEPGIYLSTYFVLGGGLIFLTVGLAILAVPVVKSLLVAVSLVVLSQPGSPQTRS